MRSCFPKVVSFGMQVIWIFTELILVQLLILIKFSDYRVDFAVTGLLVCFGSSGMFLVWQPLIKQMHLVCLKLTYKEWAARMTDSQSLYGCDPREVISFGEKWANFWDFWLRSESI